LIGTPATRIAWRLAHMALMSLLLIAATNWLGWESWRDQLSFVAEYYAIKETGPISTIGILLLWPLEPPARRCLHIVLLPAVFFGLALLIHI